MKKRLIIGLSGASGIIYGVRMLEALKNTGIETHLVVSETAQQTLKLETDYSLDHVLGLASVVHDINNLGAAIGSGSFETIGMIVAPCSMKTLSGIANSFNVNLLIRAADVTLKEGRKLVLMVRETPLHKGHLQLMLRAADIGAIIMPPLPGFYTRPTTIDDLVNQTVGKALDIFGIKHPHFRRWSGEDRGGKDI